jgi:nucleoside-diphosphate-sugar epimerase
MFSGGSALLLTGATGLVGSQLLPHLLAAKPDRRVIVLTRQRGKIPSLSLNARVTALQGDLTRETLGLESPLLSGLKGCLTEIIHCAAETRFGLPLEQARAINTVGTQNLLTLAYGCRRLEKLAHLSTVYVAGRSVGRVAEVPLSHLHGFCNTYEQSKYEAEALVVEAMGRLPAALFRLSSIIGDSEAGRVQQFNYVHQLLKLFPRNVLPVVPGEPAAPVDLIPSDWAVSALAHLFERSFTPGRVYHICAGPEASLTLRQMIDLTVSAFESHALGRRWLPIRIPELVSVSHYEAFVQSCRSTNDRLLNELLRVLQDFLPHLGLFQAFENTNTAQALAANGLKLPAIRDYYAKVVAYCLETNWGKQLQ